MNTEPRQQNDALQSVQHLLDDLNSMKREGSSPIERLEYLMAKGPELRHDFTYSDAFDAERQVLTTNLERLAELEHAVQQLRMSWVGAPATETELAAGTSLLEHLGALVKEAKSRELRSEGELLSQVWTWSPDISGTWPWLTAWKDPRVQELARTTAPRDVEPLKDVELEPSGARYELHQDEVAVPLEREVARIPEAPQTPRVEEWTRALREITLEKWEFRFAADGHVGGHGMGRTWLWMLEDDDSGSSYAKLEITQRLVRLSASSPRLREEGDGVRHLEREMTDIEKRGIFLDPFPLVKEAFGAR